MPRVIGWLLVVLILGVVAAQRWQASRRAQALLRGEAHALETVRAMARLSDELCDGSAPHPGLEALSSAVGRLVALPEVSDGERSYAHDDVYMYGLALTTQRVDGELAHGWVLRAWPREFGITGDAEYHVSEQGQLWLGHNDLGRSGLETGFPPTFPEAAVGQVGPLWMPLPRAHR